MGNLCDVARVHWPDGEEGGLGRDGMGGGEACRPLVVTLSEKDCIKATVLTLAEHRSYLGSFKVC